MKKGKIKNALKIGLCSSGLILFLAGSVLTYNASEPLLENRNKKEEIIKNYKTSQEYQGLISEKVTQYKEDYKRGAISTNDYFDAVDLLYTDGYVEGVMLESDMPEAEQIDKLNENIKSDFKKVCFSMTPMLAGAVAGAVGLVYIDKEEEKE